MKGSILLWAPALLLFLLNGLLRLMGDHDASIYLDEAASVFHALMPTEDFQDFLSRDANPPLYYVLLRQWISWFGYSELGFRSLSILFNSLTVSAVYLIGVRFFHFRTGLAAALLLIGSSFHMDYAYEARCFSMVGFLVTASFGWYLLYWERPRNAILLLWTLTNIALLYTHFAAFPMLVVQVLLLPLWWDQRKALWHALIGLGITGLALLPAFLAITPDKMQATTRWLPAPESATVWPFIKSMSNTEWLAIAMIVFALLGTILLWLHGSRAQLKAQLTFLAWGWVSLFIAFWMSQHTPFFLPKYLLYTSIGMFLSMAVGISTIRPWLSWCLLAGLLFYQMGPGQRPHIVKEDWKQAAAYALDQQQEGCILVTPVYQTKTFIYYSDPALWQKGDQLLVGIMETGIFGLNILERDFFNYQSFDRIVLVQSHAGFVDPGQKSLSVLQEEAYVIVESKSFAAISVTSFERAPQTRGM